MPQKCFDCNRTASAQTTDAAAVGLCNFCYQKQQWFHRVLTGTVALSGVPLEFRSAVGVMIAPVVDADPETVLRPVAVSINATRLFGAPAVIVIPDTAAGGDGPRRIWVENKNKETDGQ